jgi:hypothetical protein
LAEIDITSPSIYRAYVDDIDMGKFKSSGLIISTGTGSRGWLLSARRISPDVVKSVLDLLGSDEQCFEVRYYHF